MKRGNVRNSLIVMAATLIFGVIASNLFVKNESSNPCFGGRDCQVITQPDEMEYKYKPAGTPLEFAYLYGDPSKKGYYVFRVRVPPNLLQPAHFHSKDEFARVVEGKFHAGNGSKVDPNTPGLPAGTFAFVPAGCRHYAFTKDEGAIIEVSGMGPWEMLMVDENGKPTGDKMTLPPREP